MVMLGVMPALIAIPYLRYFAVSDSTFEPNAGVQSCLDDVKLYLPEQVLTFKHSESVSDHCM
jgi:hypothetical protein